jgi:LPXTG-motif cell wall-anchored protein
LKISQLIVAAATAAVSLAGFGGIAVAAPTASSAAVACAEGAPSVITDDNGVQHQACVDSAADAPALAPPANPDKASLVPKPASTPTTSSGQLPQTGTGSGGFVIATILVCSGSIASLLSRRKTRPGRSSDTPRS